MANYTVTTTAGQEATLDAVLPLINAQRVANGQSTINKTQLVDASMTDRIKDFKVQVLADQRVGIVAALDTATPAQINTIKATLGI